MRRALLSMRHSSLIKSALPPRVEEDRRGRGRVEEEQGSADWLTGAGPSQSPGKVGLARSWGRSLCAGKEGPSGKGPCRDKSVCVATAPIDDYRRNAMDSACTALRGTGGRSPVCGGVGDCRWGESRARAVRALPGEGNAGSPAWSRRMQEGLPWPRGRGEGNTPRTPGTCRLPALLSSSAPVAPPLSLERRSVTVAPRGASTLPARRSHWVLTGRKQRTPQPGRRCEWTQRTQYQCCCIKEDTLDRRPLFVSVRRATLMRPTIRRDGKVLKGHQWLVGAGEWNGEAPMTVSNAMEMEPCACTVQG